jgi:hypothetical protein
MNNTMPETYLDLLREELIAACAKRAIIQAKIEQGIDVEYLTRVLAGWDHAISQLEARIRNEETKLCST